MKAFTKYSMMCLILLLICFAAQEGRALHEVFRDLDLNKDGRVDRNEFSEEMKKDAFNKLDKDRDRELSAEEWDEGNDMGDINKHRELFKKADADQDSRITFFEFSDYADSNSNIEKAFIGLDRDGSNSLSPDEVTMRPIFKWITIRW